MNAVVSWGEVLWDRFPDGDVLGGAPANVAFHLAALGSGVAFVSRVGDDDDGMRASSALGRAGVDVSCVQVDAERATGEVGVEIANSGDAIYTLFPFRAWERIECGPAELALLRGASAFAYGTLAQRTAAGRDAHRRAIAALPPGALIVCDPNLRRGFEDWSVFRESLELANVVKINENEAREIEARFGCADAATWLHERAGVELVALTLGERGCQLRPASGAAVARPGVPAMPGGDNVGCGDAFTATLIHGLMRGWPLEEVAEAANRRASIVASHRGATPKKA